MATGNPNGQSSEVESMPSFPSPGSIEISPNNQGSSFESSRRDDLSPDDVVYSATYAADTSVQGRRLRESTRPVESVIHSPLANDTQAHPASLADTEAVSHQPGGGGTHDPYDHWQYVHPVSLADGSAVSHLPGGGTQDPYDQWQYVHPLSLADGSAIPHLPGGGTQDPYDHWQYVHPLSLADGSAASHLAGGGTHDPYDHWQYAQPVPGSIAIPSEATQPWHENITPILPVPLDASNPGQISRPQSESDLFVRAADMTCHPSQPHGQACIQVHAQYAMDLQSQDLHLRIPHQDGESAC